MLTKTELVKQIAEKANIEQKDALAAVNAFIDVTIAAYKKGENFQLAGYGTFAIHNRAERMGRLPLTGEPIKIPAQKTVKFRAAKQLKDAMN